MCWGWGSSCIREQLPHYSFTQQTLEDYVLLCITLNNEEISGEQINQDPYPYQVYSLID